MKPILFVTLKEAVRKKTFVVMSVLAVLYMLLWTLLLHYSQSQINAHGMDLQQVRPIADLMFTQMGFQFSSMLLSLLAIMVSAGCISNELESGMVHAILSRPVKRSDYVLGRFLGLCVLMAAFAAVFYFAIMLIGALFSLQTVIYLGAGQILKGWFFYSVVPLCLLCLTLYGSTLMKAVPNGLLMIFIYILGNIGGMVEMVGNLLNNKAVVSSGIFISLVSPFHTLYNTFEKVILPASGVFGELMREMNGLSGGGKPASGWMFVYIGIYAAAFVFFSIRRFERKDL